MKEKVNKKLTTLLAIIMLVIIILLIHYSYTVALYGESNSTALFILVFAIPLFLELFSKNYDYYMKQGDSLYKAEETEKLYKLGIINKYEYRDRRKTIIESENDYIRIIRKNKNFEKYLNSTNSVPLNSLIESEKEEE